MATAHEEQDTAPGQPGVLSRHPAAFAIGGGVAAAFGSSFIPMTAIEGFVTAYGIAELLPAAAPPLGDTARLALSAGIGTLTAGALLALLPRGETDDMGFETSVKQAETASPGSVTSDTATRKSGKLAGWLRTLRFGKSEAAPGTVTDFDDINRLRIRNGDQHPDAPARAPIRASSDLAEPALTSAPFVVRSLAVPPLDLGDDMAFEAPVAETPMPAQAEPVLQTAPSPRFAPPVFAKPEPFSEADAATDSLPVAENPPLDLAAQHEALADTAHENVDVEELDVAPPAVPLVSDDLAQISVPALIERLEAGLARRRQVSAARVANKVPAAEATARLFSLTKPASLSGDVSVDESSDTPTAQPMRFRLGQPPLMQPDVAQDTAAPENDSAPNSSNAWDDPVEYHPPDVETSEPLADQSLSALDETAENVDFAVGADEAPVPAAQTGDDDMDAALRDALATLRQLSDRQRNG